MILSAVAAAAIIWIAMLAVPWRPWSTREHLESDPEAHVKLDEVSILIPARNEANIIARTLKAASVQGTDLKILLVDDQSEDDTAGQARSLSLPNLEILKGTQTPPGWSGKLWALEQGRPRIRSDLILLLDADIEMQPYLLAGLRRKLIAEDLAFVSLMVELRMQAFWEKLLLPAFVYFFKLLYPFRLANSTNSWVAAAAGGCILIRRSVLEELGGFEVFKDALIDDCTLARKVKEKGHKTWIGLTRSARSHRHNAELATIWNMVARTAFTQLRYSVALLIGCTLVMALAFWAPLLGFTGPGPITVSLSALGCAAMLASYVPILRFYGISPLWSLSLPLSASLYLAMTWTSAIRYFRGERSHWKGRSYGR